MSHPLPVDASQGGDTTGGGGGGRQLFVDSRLFRQVTTDADGRAQVSFRLSDDLTSWHVSAAAMTSVPEAGSASILVPVGLPFFVEATIAPEYLVMDQPILASARTGRAERRRPGDVHRDLGVARAAEDDVPRQGLRRRGCAPAEAVDRRACGHDRSLEW
jgi:hypothetical protein